MKTSTQNNQTLFVGEVVDLSADSILFRQVFCRCFNSSCECTGIDVWISKSIITCSPLYDKAFAQDSFVWERGRSYNILVPQWFLSRSASLFALEK